jgi:hypothetical protein
MNLKHDFRFSPEVITNNFFASPGSPASLLAQDADKDVGGPSMSPKLIDNHFQLPTFTESYQKHKSFFFTISFFLQTGIILAIDISQMEITDVINIFYTIY